MDPLPSTPQRRGSEQGWQEAEQDRGRGGIITGSNYNGSHSSVGALCEVFMLVYDLVRSVAATLHYAGHGE